MSLADGPAPSRSARPRTVRRNRRDRVTRLFVRVADAAESALAAAAGFDGIEVRLGSVQASSLAPVRAARLAFPGTLRVSLDGLSFAKTEIDAALSVGADELAMAIDASPTSIPVIDAERPPKLTAVARLAIAPDTADALQRVRRRVERVVIESGRAPRLFDRAGIAQLAALADLCRASDLPFGFSGGLEAPDIPRLLLLRPDTLGLDTAVRSNHKADGRLLPHLLDAMRALVPRDGVALPARPEASVTDTIFVRDFVVPLSIGAYRAEEHERQRVRFTVEAGVMRRAGPPRDMRDVFSYDVILETIRVLAERAHTAFVETLAEEVAASLLAQEAIETVTVTVEKLDIIEGSVGVAITRSRSR